MENQTKVTAGLALLAVLGWGAFAVLARRGVPDPVEKTVYVDKVVTVDRVVTKDRVRTETRPDGTKIVTVEKTGTTEHSTDTDKSRQVVVSTASKTKYSLGLGLVLDPFNPLNRVYSIEAGKRLWDSPIWMTASYQTNKTLLFGLRVEF